VSNFLSTTGADQENVRCDFVARFTYRFATKYHKIFENFLYCIKYLLIHIVMLSFQAHEAALLNDVQNCPVASDIDLSFVTNGPEEDLSVSVSSSQTDSQYSINSSGR